MLQNYIEQLGSVAEFMPQGMKAEYQYICVENLFLLEDSDTQTRRYILKSGLVSRFNTFDALSPPSDTLLEDYLDKLLNALQNTHKMLSNSSEKLREQFKTQPDTKSMDAFLRSLQAYRKIRAALDLPASQSLSQFQQAEQLLKSSLEINDFDYIAYFQLGWLYLWILNQADKAEHFFELASTKSVDNDQPFYIFTQRHLAFTHFIKQQYVTAKQITQDIHNTKETSDSTESATLLSYEQARYALYAYDTDDFVDKISHLSAQHPLYYLLIQTELPFQEQSNLHDLPEQIRSNKIQAIQKSFDQRWKRCPLRLIQMEEGCNVNRVYYRTLKHYLPELDNVAFTDLESQSQKLGDTVFQVTRANIATEIDKRFQKYTQEIEVKQSSYVWLHRIGKLLFSASLYIIVALLVLGIYLVMDRYFIPGDSGITVNNWMLTLSGMIFVLIIGFIATIFETRPVSALFAKQKLVNEALEKLHRKPSSG